MIAGSYTMHLYCEVEEHHPLDAEYNRTDMIECVGKTRAGCRRQARAWGWTIVDDQLAYCPAHRAEAVVERDRPAKG